MKQNIVNFLLVLTIYILFIDGAKAQEGQRETSGAATAISLVGAGLNVGVGAILLKQCPEPLECGMGLAAMAQSLSNFIPASAASDKSYDAAGLNGDFRPFQPGQVPEVLRDLGVNGDMTAADIRTHLSNIAKDGVRKANENGFSANAEQGTVTIPGKGEVPMSQLGSGGGGVGSSESLKKANAEIAKVSEKAKRDLQKIASRAGSTSAGSAQIADIGKRSGSSNESGTFSWSQFMPKSNANRAPASAEAFSKLNSQGEAIGVSAANIFQIVSRRYHKMESTNFLIPSTQ